MNKKLRLFLSMLLSVVMVINLLPLSVIGEEVRTLATDTNNTATSMEEVYIVGEVIENRSEYSKQYMLSNGLYMAAVYGEAVHYEDEGEWKEIDNTLKSSGTGADAVYINTAGLWDISFPQKMSAERNVTITKNGYSLSFVMSGELLASEDEGIATASAEGGRDQGQFERREMRESTAQERKIDMSQEKEEAEFSETVPEKIYSRLEYEDVFDNTNIIYDLRSNQLKESIVLEAYNDSLRGYQYTLQVGDMNPVLTESGQIELYDKNGKNLIMVMPAPYMVDNGGEYSFSVTVELQRNGEGTYTLSYILPTDWLADEGRQWPVVLDPIVYATSTISNIKDQAVYSNTYLSYGNGVLQVGYKSSFGIGRAYLMYETLPTMTSADVIVYAAITLQNPNNYSKAYPVEVHKVQGTWTSSTITWENKPDYGEAVEDFVISKARGAYTWEITDIVRGWYEGENTGMMFKTDDASENTTTDTSRQFYSSDYSKTMMPTMYIVFRNNNGLESYWDYTASSAGRAGTGYINNYTGNLVWTHSDIGFGGNRMPVSISHVYNANDSAKNEFGMGYGWRTNFNQLVYQWTENTNYYVWEDSDGTSHYFLKESTGVYKDEDGLELTLTTTGSGDTTYCIKDKYDNKSYFDTYGRLTKQENNQTTASSITVSYTTTSGYLISEVKDGAGRVYRFDYSDDLLTGISYLGSGTKEVSYVSFAYSDAKLTSITNVDGEATQYTYADNTADTSKNLLTTAVDIDGYKLVYTYTTFAKGKPARVASVTEYSGTTQGGSLLLEYANNQTTFTDHNGNVQIMQFNNFGNTVSIQDDQGRAQFANYANNDAISGNGSKGNQLTLSSKLQNTVGNVLMDSSFENSTTWTVTSSSVTGAIESGTAYMGDKSLALTRETSGTAAGVYSAAFSVAAGETYTFSAYVKTGNGSAYLALHDGTAAVTSEILAKDSGWTRLEVSYTADTAKTLTARLMTTDAGTVYMDCVQVEKAETASRYNLIQNGDFRDTAYWSSVSGITTVAAAEIEAVPALELDESVYQLTGVYNAQNRISQTVAVSGDTGDTFVLAGWAKGDSAPLNSSEGDTQIRRFSLIATFTYTDGTTSDEMVASFNPDADSSINWQYAASAIVAEKAYSAITVIVAYDYNVNTAYFDGIQLYKEEFGTSYTYDGDGNVETVTDVQGGTTTYTYDDNNNLTTVKLPDESILTYTYYEGTHNVETATTNSGVTYKFEYDTFGNNTSVSIVSGGVVITSTASYTEDGNRLVSTTDAAGNVTTYSYNANTNVLEWVQYPEDSEATRTEYTYDEMCRLASAEATTDTGSALTASYTYEDDVLTEIKTASTTYSFSYGAFALRSSIQIGSRTLASYKYTSGNNYLETLAYGNGDSVKYTYDDHGRVTQQTYEDGDTVSYKYDNSGALATVYDSATGITTTYYYDFTYRMMKYVESGSGYTHSVGYAYDEINNLTSLVETINGVEHTTTYAYDDDNRVTSVTNGTVSRSYVYDAYSRVKSQLVKYGNTVMVATSYTYRNPTATTTTGQVSELAVSASGFNATYSYGYDDNGNIVAVFDGTYLTEYVYDTAGQLLMEINEAAGKAWTWEYDNAGNILSKEEQNLLTGETTTVNYSYARGSGWGDLLTAYGEEAITYDAIGNPITWGADRFAWEHGRELSLHMCNGVTWTYTYDANGMRTSRTSNTENYRYIYNGSSLTLMQSSAGIFYFSYGAEGTPISVTVGNATYYYVTNLQGDVVAILYNGSPVVQYTYDAWGKVLSITGTMADTIGKYNPLRYRGYVYDTETGFYYVSSRYYDPEIGRFINADAFASTGQGIIGNNMFAYCGNNPVVRADPSGESFAIVLGFNFNLFGWGMIGTINLVSTEENFGVQYSYYISDDPEISEKSNQTIGVDVGPYVGVQYTDKKSMEELEGYAKATGGDLILGIDVLTEEDGDYLGWQFGSSVFSANMHSLYTNTETLFSVPTLDLVEIIVDWIFGEK